MRSQQFTLTCVGIVAAIFHAHLASAGTLYTVRDADDRLIAIDTTTLSMTDVGPLGVAFEFGGLGYDPSSDTLYMIGGDINKALYRIDRATGSATLIGNHDVPRLFGLDYDSKNNVLYASQYSVTPALYTLDLRTGAATRVGDLDPNGLGALAYDPESDALIGMAIDTGNLFEVDRSSGATTLLADGDSVNDGGLAFDTENNLIWHIDFSGNLYSYDPASGYSRMPRLNSLGAHDGLAFVPENIPAAPGKYSGLLQSAGSPSHSSTGSIALNVTSSGKFTGKLSVGGQKYKLKGTFDATGAAVVTPKGAEPSFTLALQFKATNGARQISGTTSGAVNASVRANRSVFHKKKNPAPAEFVGRFTALFEPTSTAAGIPQGIGYATIKATAGGSIRVAGRLADGTKISQGTVVSARGEWPLYAPIYKKQGFLAGFVQFEPVAGISDFSGTLEWLKPATSGVIDPGAFTTDLDLIGSRYTPPDRQTRVLDFGDTSPNGEFSATEGDLTEPFNRPITLSADNKITVTTVADGELKLSVKTSNGLVQGNLLSSGKKRNLFGVIFQKQNVASGFFHGATESGTFRVVKSP